MRRSICHTLLCTGFIFSLAFTAGACDADDLSAPLSTPSADEEPV